MALNSSKKVHISRPSSPVYLHVDKSTPIHLYVDNEEIGDFNVIETNENAASRDVSRRRRPMKPGVNVPTAKLMGKKKVDKTKRFRSISPPWIPPPARTTRGSKSSLGPFWTEEEADIGQQGRYETKINELLDEVGDLRDQLNRERQQDEIRRSHETLRAQEGKIEELKQEIDLVEKENNALKDNFEQGRASTSFDESDNLIKALIETELSAGRCQHQMHHVLDNLRNILKEGHKVTARDLDRINGYFHDSEARLFEFKSASNELRGFLKLFQQREVLAREALQQDNSFLQQRRSELEQCNDRLQAEAGDKEAVIGDLRRQLARKNDESLNFASTHESLESVKGHLQQQLKQRAGDCNRMAVQIRTLESDLTKERLDKEHLVELLKQPRDRESAGEDRENLKRAARAQKQRAQKAEEVVRELEALLAEKDRQIEDLLMESRDNHEQLGQMGRVVEENDILHSKLSHSNHEGVIMSLRRENENLRSVADQCESRLKDVEREMDSLRRNLGEEDSRDDSQLEKLSQLVQKLEAAEKAHQTSQARAEELERKVKAVEGQNSDLKNAVQQKESNVNDNRCKADDLVRENAALMRQLEAALVDSRRNADNAREKISSKDRSLQSRLHDLESQLAQQRAEVAKWRRNCEENERKGASKLQDLKVQLEQAEATNRSMHTYVQFLKKSYANVFGDIPLPNGLSNSGGF